MLSGKHVLLVVSGGIAAYKSLDLIRRLRGRGAHVRVVLTEAATEFVTPLSVSAISGEEPFIDLFDRSREADIGHIRLAREADIVIVAPATADILARMAGGLAPDLATAVLLATRAPVLVAPAMNPAMWAHPATRRNAATLVDDGVTFIGPAVGEMAESGEAGLGRMVEPDEILAATQRILAAPSTGMLADRHVLVTAGPTNEPLDPIRHISNRSSGRQGFAIARAAAESGAIVTLVTGPVHLDDPAGATVVRVETAEEMLSAVEASLPVDIAIMTAAVSDWRPVSTNSSKIKKNVATGVQIDLTANPDILARIANHPTMRPPLVIGFAAETDDIAENAHAKLRAKGCDWILANDVSRASGAMGGPDNEVKLITMDGIEEWPLMTKAEVAERLIDRIGKLPALRHAAE
ncbi:MAG: bifunctional phosphopantothenoylcysteine decarboxylase/phosphopantothenate--cysteine ligase CoaBC [Alphaproteobacteria bacterium]